MPRKRALKRNKKRVRLGRRKLAFAFTFGLVLGLLVFGLERRARAASLDEVVNTEIKQEFIRTDAQKMRANYNYADPEYQGLVPSQTQAQAPLNSNDPALDDQDPTGPGEQAGAIEMPQGGIAKKIDPSDPIEQEIAEKQAYDLYRDNYRRAVQAQFLSNLHRAGYTTSRNVAAEIKAQEMRLKGIAPSE